MDLGFNKLTNQMLIYFMCMMLTVEADVRDERFIFPQKK